MDNVPTKQSKTIIKIKVQPKPNPADERSKEAWNDLNSQLLDWD